MADSQETQNISFKPFHLIFYAFFQRARLTREFQPASLLERGRLMAKLAIPMFLIGYPLALFGEIVLFLSGLHSGTTILNFFLEPAFGIAFGIAFSIAFGIAVGIALGIAGGIVVGIAGGIVVGIAGGIAVGIAVGIAFSIAGGIAFSIAFSIAVGIVVGIAFGIVGDIAFGIAGSIAGGIGAFLGLYRVPLYLISGSSALLAYFTSRERRHEALELLHHSSLHWDELVYVPLPFLKQTLLNAYEENSKGTLAEIAFIAAERPQQLRGARAAALEIVMRELEKRKSMQQIAGAAQRLNEILPPETKLSDPRWASFLPRLSDASREAMRCLQPIGRQARLTSLDKMMEDLNRIRPSVAFRDQQLNQRLKQVIAIWLAAAQEERGRLERAAQDIGNIDNPYKSGQPLEPHDPLFVGRQDLARQLEYAMSKGSSCPTLLLYGERRMGKTSTLRQLSYLLGTGYVPVVYNLQDPKLYARTATLMGTLASGIHEVLLNRGIKVEALPFVRLQESRAVNDAMTYAIFDRWLKGVESVLEEEGRTLLLAFDEFEKLDEVGERGILDLSLFLDWCRQIIQFHPRVVLLFSGVHQFSDMGAKTGLNWSNYFVNVQALKVSFLERDEARRLIISPRPDYEGKQFFGEVVEQIIQQTHSHPFLVQALCSQLVDTLNAEKSEHVLPDHVVRAVGLLVDSWDGYFDDLWKRCDKVQQSCLLALSSQKSATLDDIRRQSNLDEKNIRTALRALSRRDLILREDEKYYRIATPIFARWVEDNA